MRILLFSAFRIANTLAVLLAAATCLLALQPNHSLTEYGHVSWSEQDSQLPGAVNAIAQAADGSLWAGTEFGLFRFDGTTFTAWKPPAGAQLPSQTISSLAATPDGGLWIGTRNGLSYWKGNQLKHYLTTQAASGPGISSVVVDHSGAAWAGTVGYDSGGLCRIQEYRAACYGPAEGYDGNGVLQLFEDKTGNLWIGSIHGLYRWNSDGFRHYGPRGPVQGIVQSSDGGIIIPSPVGLSQLVNERLTGYSAGKLIRGTNARVFLLDRDGALWIGTLGNGLFHLYDGRSDRITHVDGLSGDNVLSLFEDREGNIWVGTDKGVDKFRDLPVTTLSRREGLPTDAVVSAFASGDSGVWLGTMNGVNKVSEPGIDVNRSLLPVRSIGSIFEDRLQTLWITSPKGLGFFQAGELRWLELPGAQQIGAIAAIAQDRAGSIWFSDVNRGLIRVDEHQAVGVVPWSRFHSRVAWALEANPVNGGLLIGFAQGGVADFDGDRVTRWYRDADGLASGAVTDLHFDSDGTAWIATEGGLSRLKNGRIATLGLSNGLPCETIHAMVEDDDRNLWLNTPCGLLRVTRRDLIAWAADPKTRVKPMLFGARDGVRLHPRKYGYFRGAVKSSDGRLWFPVLDGVAVVDPRHLPHNPLPPPVEIQSILADKAARAIQPGLKLPHISQDLQIDYTAFSFVDPERVLFKYQLQGYDKTWIEAGNRRQAVYPVLPPGKYVFHVIACNNDGVWNDVGASLDFSVAPTFYQTVWFRLLAAIALAGMAWTAYTLRVRDLEAKLKLRFDERIKERTRISRELHDTLLQNIAGLALQLDAISKIVTAPLPARDQLRDLRRQAESWLREARESVWQLRLPASDDEDLGDAIRRSGNEILEGKDIAFEMRSSGCRRTVDSQTKQSLIRIVQEALRNASHHSHASRIDVHLRWMAGKQLLVEIRDDGRGFNFDEASRKTGHLGLASMRERAREIGAQFQMDTSPGQGVRIEIRSPLAPPRRLKND